MKRTTTFLRTALLALLAAVAAACSELPSAPAHETPTALVESGELLRLKLGSVTNLLDGWMADSPDLLASQLNTELARIAEAETLAQATYETLVATASGPLRTVGALLACNPLQYSGTSRIIGPEGGTIDFGPHTLVIPAGALRLYTVITAEAPPSLLAEAKFSPHGLTFVRSAALRMSYKHCAPPKKNIRIVYIDSADAILEWTQPLDLGRGQEVWGGIDHFSRYAVAAN